MDKWYIRQLPPPKIKKFREENKFIDVKLILDDREIHAHKFILAMYIKQFESLFLTKTVERKIEEISIHPPDADVFESFINILYYQEPLAKLKTYEENYLTLKILETLDYLQMELDYENIIKSIYIPPENFDKYVSLILKILGPYKSTFTYLVSQLVYGENLSLLSPYKNEIMDLISPTIVYYNYKKQLTCINIYNDIIYRINIPLETDDLADFLTSDRLGRFYLYIARYDKTINVLYANGILYKQIQSKNSDYAAICDYYVAYAEGIYDMKNDTIVYTFESPINMCIFSYDKRFLCYTDNKDRRLNILDINKGKIIYQFTAEKIYDMDINRDNILFFSTPNIIYMLNIETMTYSTLEFNAYYLSLSPKFKYIAFAHRTVLIYDYEKNRIFKRINIEFPRVLKWSEDTRYIYMYNGLGSYIYNIDIDRVILNIKDDGGHMTWLPRYPLIDKF